ncbi:cytochrome c oxidase assembly protein COX15 homolog [Drosophila guanche]|uniref:Blast:THO complex subunit 5 n=2 Tax=Drosophila guanche TaxID=7266 RepID=A0A3B0IYL2_DROGU|nr:cytochrome c oxidase assembly protein COX15 homolog [Drosophila guanche]SPP73184.1 blast:THO complex subunit 5 [Drosophila guanche]
MLRMLQKRTSMIKLMVPRPRLHQTIAQTTIKEIPTIKHATISNSEKTVGRWFLGVSGMVFVAVGLGGVTRLTESGLSMVTWKLTGERMPRTQEDWVQEFTKYQQYPEYKLKNANMTVEEFKFIYLMEYIHRMWGRAIGGFFLVPAAYFWKKGYFCAKTKKSVLLLGTLIGLQGLMGWYMVKSGLENRFEDPNDVPRVSQYRLASHLAAAFVLYSLSLSQAMSKLFPAEPFVVKAKKAFNIKGLSHMTKGMVFLTAISGAFVAGLDAGLVYNSFPKMGDSWIPDDMWQFKPVQRNITENPTTVQFNHRILGITTVSLATALWLVTRRMQLPKRTNWAINAVFAMAWTQATLGVTTLLTYVPVPLATAHQSGSLVLLSFALWLSHEIRFLKYLPK